MSSNKIFGAIVVLVILIIFAVLYYVMVYNPSVSVSVNRNIPEENMYPQGADKVVNVNIQSNKKASRNMDPISLKTQYNDKGSVVGSEKIEHFSNDRPPNSSYPKDQLSAEDLLPQDQSSLWASVNPSGQGTLKDRNFLQSAYHIGINTVGQTLRNANLQLRSEPPNPQVKVSPWLQSTIEPDVSRKPFEIGAC